MPRRQGTASLAAGQTVGHCQEHPGPRHVTWRAPRCPLCRAPCCLRLQDVQPAVPAVQVTRTRRHTQASPRAQEPGCPDPCTLSAFVPHPALPMCCAPFRCCCALASHCPPCHPQPAPLLRPMNDSIVHPDMWQRVGLQWLQRLRQAERLVKQYGCWPWWGPGKRVWAGQQPGTRAGFVVQHAVSSGGGRRCELEGREVQERQAIRWTEAQLGTRKRAIHSRVNAACGGDGGVSDPAVLCRRGGGRQSVGRTPQTHRGGRERQAAFRATQRGCCLGCL